MRYFIEIAYKGTHFHGWQKQPNAVTIQQEMEKALSTLLNSSIEITGSGRTDTGVHAKKQIAHFDYQREINISDLTHKLNSYLRDDIAIHWIRNVKDEAHARFSAFERAYEYHIHTVKSPFLTELSFYYPKSLDINQLNFASSQLVGTKDFQALSKVKTDVHTFNCNIKEAFWEEKQNGFVFHIRADRFLRGMVRTIVGTFLEIAEQKRPVNDFESIIASRDRQKAGRSVPPHGLYLNDVCYPDLIFI